MPYIFMSHRKVDVTHLGGVMEAKSCRCKAPANREELKLLALVCNLPCSVEKFTVEVSLS